MKEARQINPMKWILIGGGVILLPLIFIPRPSGIPELEIGQVFQLAESGQVAKIEVKGDKLEVETTNGDVFRSRKEDSVSVLGALQDRGIATGKAEYWLT